jgi:hypothetical protein
MNNNGTLIIDILQGLAGQLAILIAAIVGAIVTLSRWKDSPSAGFWSLLGFGLAIILCFAIPAAQAGLRYWLIQNSAGHPAGHSSTMMIFGAFNILWSLLRAASYICLLVAIYAGRPEKPEPLR